VEQEERQQLFGKQLLKKLLVPLAIGVIAYAGLLLYGDAEAVAAGVAHVPARTLLLALGLSLASFGLRWLRWQYYLGRMGLRVPAGISLRVLLIGFAMSITPGKVGELLKSLLLKEAADVPVARSMPVVLAERVSDLTALVAIGLVGFLWSSQPLLAVLLIALMVGSFFALGRSKRLGGLLLSVAGRVPNLNRYRDKLATTLDSLHELWHPQTYVAGTLLSVVVWQLQALIVIVIGTGLGTPVTLQQACVAYSAPLLAGSLALLPGGLGVAEASMAGVLRTLAGMTPTAATTLTILVCGVTFWFAIVLGLCALGSWRFQPQVNATSKSSP
jgi:glycosyltransferase 2 family protein